MKKLLIFLKKYTLECLLAPLFKLFEAALELLVPLVVAAIIDRGIGTGDKGFVLHMGALLAAFALVGLTFSITAQFFSAKAAIGFSGKLRIALLDKIQSLSYSDLDGIGTSALMTRMTSDVNQVQTGVNLTLRLLLRSPFVVLGAMVMAFTIHPGCALIFAGVIALLCAAVFFVMRVTIPQYGTVQSVLDGVTAAARENLNGTRVLRAFGQEKREVERFEKRGMRLEKLQLWVGKLSALMNPLTLVIVNAGVIVLLRTGALKVDSGVLTQGQTVALYDLMSQILVELIKTANWIITVTKALACAGRLSKTLDTVSTASHGSLTPAPDAPHGSVTLKNVSFAYNGAAANAVENISFSVAPGSTIGIIGGTGSGKSTLMNLIAGFYDVTEGSILVDGVELAGFDRHELRRRVAIVPQRAVLFKGTIRDNLLMGLPENTPETSDQALMDAVKAAQAEEIIADNCAGLDRMLAQGGGDLSGGQRQRLTIARALVRRPEILILDDSASALDQATEARLRLALAALPCHPTTFIVSQRAQSIRYADEIIVMDDGRIAGIGTHDDLIRKCTVYREIYRSQFPEGDDMP